VPLPRTNSVEKSVLEKLIGFQLVMKFPACDWIRRFSTAFASDSHLS